MHQWKRLSSTWKKKKKKSRGRPKLTLIDIVKNDMSINEVTKSMTSDRIEWRKRIHMINLD